MVIDISLIEGSTIQKNVSFPKTIMHLGLRKLYRSFELFFCVFVCVKSAISICTDRSFVPMAKLEHPLWRGPAHFACSFRVSVHRVGKDLVELNQHQEIEKMAWHSPQWYFQWPISPKEALPTTFHPLRKWNSIKGLIHLLDLIDPSVRSDWSIC